MAVSLPWRVILLSVLAFGHLQLCWAALIIQANDTTTRVGPMRNEYIWVTEMVASNVTLINLHRDRQLFDYCNLNAYTPSGIKKLLDAHHHDSNRQWIGTAIFKDSNVFLSTLCATAGTSWTTSYILSYGILLTSYVQKAGGKGYMYASAHTAPMKFWSIDGLDKEKRTVFDVEMNSFAICMTNQTSIDVLVDRLEDSWNENVSLVASSLSADRDRMDDAFTNPFSVYFMSHYVIWPLLIFCIWLNTKLIFTYYYIKNKSLPFNYCTFSLIVSLIANITRAVRLIDFMGFSGTIPILYGRVFGTLPFVLGLSGTTSTFFFWIEASVMIEHSLNLKMVASRKRFKALTLLISLVLVFVDVSLAEISLFGVLSGSVTIIPSLTLILFEMIVSTAILMTTWKMRITIQKIKSSINPAPLTRGPSNAVPASTAKNGSPDAGETTVSAGVSSPSKTSNVHPEGNDAPSPAAPTVPRNNAARLSQNIVLNSPQGKVAQSPPAPISPRNNAAGLSQNINLNSAAPRVNTTRLASQNVTVSTAGGGQYGQLANIKYALISKLELAEIWMTRCGVLTIPLMLSIALLGSGIMYNGPSHLALFSLSLLFDQIVTYVELRVLSISIAKTNST